MSKIQEILKEIFETPKLMAKYRESQNFEELHKLCKEIKPDITEKEVKEGFQELITENSKNTALPISDEELAAVGGGSMDFNKFKASAIAALVLVGGIGPVMETKVSAGQPISSASTVDAYQKQEEINEKPVAENEIENLYNEAVKLYKGGNKDAGLKKLREILHTIKKNDIKNLYNEAVKLYNKGNKEAGLKKLGEALHKEQDLHGYLDWEKELDGKIPTSYDHITGEMSTIAFDDVDYNVWRGKDGKFYHENVGKDANPRLIATKEATIKMINNFKTATGY